MSHHVFLSYSRNDREIMTRIFNDLQAEGFQVWFDEEGIPVGTSDWKMNIENAIKQANCLVCILTPTASQSRWVRAELDLANNQKKQIYLVMADGDETHVPFGYTSNQWIDIRKGGKLDRYPIGITTLISVLAKSLEFETFSSRKQEEVERKRVEELREYFESIRHTEDSRLITDQITRLRFIASRLDEIADGVVLKSKLVQGESPMPIAISDQFRILFLGEFKTGKSTLINAIVGKKILPALPAPNTMVPIELGWANKTRYLLHKLDWS